MRRIETPVRLTKDVKEYLAQRSLDTGISQSQYVERMLLAEKNKNQENPTGN